MDILSWQQDILHALGRVSKPVFVRHYLKENPAELRDRIFKALAELEQTI